MLLQPIPIADAMTPSFARANGAFPDEQRTKTDLPAFWGCGCGISPISSRQSADTGCKGGPLLFVLVAFFP